MAPSRILLAEDNPADVYLIREALSEYGVACDLRIVPDGKSALAFFGSVPSGADSPHLIVLDLNLPQHDGIEVLRAIRACQGLHGVPVVILTSSDSPRDRRAADQLGVTQYIRKPSQLEEYMQIGATLRDLLQVQSTRDRRESTP